MTIARRRFPAWIALLPMAALLGVMACGGDGCGEDPNARKDAPKASSGGGGGGPSSGGGEVNVADWDGNQGGQQQASAPQQPPQQQQPAAPPPQAPPAIQDVTKGQWPPLVLKSTEPVLVLVMGRSCPDCDLVSPVISQLKPDFPRWSFFKLDAADPDSKALLPRGMTPLPLPAFVIYERGFARSRRQGLPFSREKSELDVDYQTRLSRWFRDALTQKTFAFARK